MAHLAPPNLLTQIRDVLDGPIVVMKGPEVATYYPDPSSRPFRDLDLLMHDAERAYRSLVRAGWEAVSEARPHHLPELLLPGTGVSVELHTAPNWPWWTTADARELFQEAIPSALGVDGVQTLWPAHHALLLAAHSRQHEPIRRLIDLIDVALLMQQSDKDIVECLARRWGLGRVWNTTTRTMQALFLKTPLTSPIDCILVRHCQEVRQRTPFESRLAYVAAGLWAPRPSTMVAATAARAIMSVVPALPKSWGSAVQRTQLNVHRSIRKASESPRARP